MEGVTMVDLFKKGRVLREQFICSSLTLLTRLEAKSDVPPQSLSMGYDYLCCH